MTLVMTTAWAQKITLGSCILKDGGKYKGELMAGKAHGKGQAVYKNGDIYEGEYVKGKRQGYGVYTFSDGEKYEGLFNEGLQTGIGKELTPRQRCDSCRISRVFSMTVLSLDFHVRS